MSENYSDIIDFEWGKDSLANRMSLNQRAKIFLPFSALAGYDDALKETQDRETERYLKDQAPSTTCTTDQP